MTSTIAVAINRTQKVVIMEDDTLLSFDAMLDESGEETDDPQKCVIAIVKLPCGKWTGVDLREFEQVTLQ